MTGKELIIYILQNNLEHKNILSKEEAALKFGVALETVEVMYKLNMIQGFKMGTQLYIFADEETKLVNK